MDLFHIVNELRGKIFEGHCKHWEQVFLDVVMITSLVLRNFGDVANLVILE